ncbi:diguanylate cyclase (GGDEF)-like protein [Sulfuritortus calidifontis]|uniref:Diguanylate cyclase (GGDEF)-like protein n=1 Tax=Sulfuritortus calidifontis TaxID=1914471 RepID=A0A4R3JZB8_9PROT|nr:EAL domain-containing protein [Sulfuritortus calidifontis]TCS72727.1 diguanylate cyclase (GGDEF)-like protein [Sulfuritortus calidifontis]
MPKTGDPHHRPILSPDWEVGLAAGFFVQILLILFVAYVGIRELRTAENRLKTISEQQILKLDLSKTMHTAVRERTASIVRVTVLEDPFEQDAEYTHFNQMASDFVAARSRFAALPLTPAERTLLDAQGVATSKSYQLAERTFELAMAGDREGAKRMLVQEAIPAQSTVLDILSRLDEMTRQTADTAIEQAKQEHAAARNWIFLLSTAALLIGLVVAGIVVHYTRRAGREREHLATHDSLTQLPNRMLLMGRLEQAIARALRHKFMVGVMFIDLDRFKLVNDTLGHAAGDTLIRHIADRLRTTVRSEDIVSRLGGDEFVVVVTDAEKISQILHVADKVMEAVTRTYQIADRDLYVTCSIGISVCPNDGTSPHDLLQHADTAMYHAKEAGRNRYQMFDTEMNTRVAKRLELETELRQGISRGEFQPYYQPQINLESGRIHVVEALMRWHHPTRGTVEPASYLDLLEETGIIVELGRRLLLDACKQCAQWLAEGHAGLAVAINLSGKEFWQEDLIDFIRAALAETRLPAEHLHLELTETILMQDIGQAVDRIQQLKQMGVRVAVDDFGTGYSSLAHLKHFPVDTLKIDRFFIKDIHRQPIDAAITQAIINLSDSLGLDTVVEGVEDAEQLAALRRLGCRVVQGYLISRPLPGKDIGAMLSQDWSNTLDAGR